MSKHLVDYHLHIYPSGATWPCREHGLILPLRRRPPQLLPSPPAHHLPCIAASTSSCPGSPLSSTLTHHSVHTILLLVYWSAPNGQHSIGTPAQTLSSIEFHP